VNAEFKASLRKQEHKDYYCPKLQYSYNFFFLLPIDGQGTKAEFGRNVTATWSKEVRGLTLIFKRKQKSKLGNGMFSVLDVKETVFDSLWHITQDLLPYCRKSYFN
jgi:hypothetical protein